MKKDLQLSYLRAKKLNLQANSERALVLRQQYGLKMLALMQKGSRIVNIDETWLNETSFIRRAWGKRDGTGNTILHRVSPRISMISALDNEGNVWYCLSHANTDSFMMALFLH